MGRRSDGAISSVFEVSATLRSKVLSLVHRTAGSAGVPRITTLQENIMTFVPMMLLCMVVCISARVLSGGVAFSGLKLACQATECTT